LPWEALTRPLAAFAALKGPQAWLPGLGAQFLLFLAGSILAAPGNNDLVRVFRGTAGHNPVSLLNLLGLAASALLLTVLLNGIFAGLLVLGFRLLGFYRPYRQVLAMCSLLFLPLALGQTLGQLLFALTMPLSSSAAEILAWQIRPYSAGLATWLPASPAPLSLQWALLSAFDLFGLWSLGLGWIGIRKYLDAPRLLTPWLQLVLLLVYAACAIGLWQAAQAWLAAVKTG
jgi:hypothetical protein